MARLPVVVAFLMLAAPVSAGLLESLTGGAFTYQDDAGTDQDAPDTCPLLAASPLPFNVPRDNQTYGVLLPGDDPADHYRVILSSDDVGDRFLVTLQQPSHGPSLTVDLLIPDCSSSVTDPENQPFPPPAPPPPAPGQKVVHPHNLPEPGGNGNCDPTRYRFRMNQIATPPPTIHVVWTNGAQANVSLTSFGSTTAYYETTLHLAYSLYNVSANVPQSWSGQFNVNKRPCNTVDGGAVFGPPNTKTNSTVEFTAAETGAYVFVVRMADPDPSLVVPLNCHTFCAAVTSLMAYGSGYTRQ